MKYPGFKKRAVFYGSLGDLISFCRLKYWNPVCKFYLDSDEVVSVLSRGPREAVFYINRDTKYQVSLVVRYNSDSSFTVYDKLD